MHRARWSRLRELFRSAEPLAAEAREAYLAEHCADDPELREEIRRLLATPTGAGLDQIVRDAIAASDFEDVRRERIGPYRIIETLGEGGMGHVYLAERDDQHYRQRVAIKVVGFPGAAKQFVARFRAERQILANLRHPYIAQLLDGGETDDGLPYLVMEYVEGRSISDFCSDNDLPLRERLLLFRKVCQAVEHAHRNLVIHRDIKPANIWVTSEGVPKLLDFGIAKLVDEVAVGQTVAVTRMDMRLLTPEYASPEQLTGGAATTSTDVYGLGVLLYELLTGCFPYGRGTASQDLRRLICETDPELPSGAALRPAPEGADSGDRRRVGATPRQLHGALRGDLDNIVMMAMRKEPARRYGSAAQLADDIERHLNHLPVRARAESRGYVAAKFIRRHVVPLAAAAVVLVTVAAVTIAFNIRLGQQRDEARRERDRALAAEVQAEREATTARTVSDFLVDLFESADPSSTENSGLTTTDLLERAIARVDEELDGQPATQARLLGTLASVHTNLNELEEARALAERGVALAETVAATEPLVLASALDVMAEVVWRLDRIDEAVALGSKSLEIRRRDGPEVSADLAQTLETLAIYVYYQDRFDECEELLRAAIAMQEQIAGPDDLELAGMLNNLGVLYDELDRSADAVDVYRRSLAIRELALGSEHVRTNYSRTNLAGALPMPEGAQEAESLARAALVVFESEFGAEHSWVGQAAYTIAEALRAQGRLDEAEEYGRKAVAAQMAADGADSPWTSTYLDTLAEIQLEKGDVAAARESAERALAIIEARRDQDAWWVHRPLFVLARVELADGRAAEAEALLQRALALAEDHAGGETVWVEDTLVELAKAYTAQGRSSEAQTLEERAAALRGDAANDGSGP